MNLSNINIKEESKKPYASHPMAKAHERIMQVESGEDLHSALKSCNEIDSAKTLLHFLSDLQKVEGFRVPTQLSVA